MWTVAGWLTGMGVTVVLYLGVSLWVDGQVRPGTWERLGLAVLVLCGPVGALLTFLLVCSALWEARHAEWPGRRRVVRHLRRQLRRRVVWFRRQQLLLRGSPAVPAGVPGRMFEE